MCEELYQRAVERWGQDAQLRRLQEEACELAAEINRCFREQGLTHGLIEELADVQIMMAQVIKIILSDEELRDFNNIRAAKLLRLKERLDQP